MNRNKTKKIHRNSNKSQEVQGRPELGCKILKLMIVSILLVIIFFASCDKQPVSVLKESKSLIDTTIYSVDTFHFSLGFYRNQEDVSIISHPSNSTLCEIITKSGDERIFRYLPQIDFQGLDTIVVEATRGSDEGSPPTEISTIIFIINVANDGFFQALLGKWNWVSSCGGWTGGCWYPNEQGNRQIEFDRTMTYTITTNASVIELQYRLVDRKIYDDRIYYKIEFINHSIPRIWFSDDNLYIQPGDWVEEYERVK